MANPITSYEGRALFCQNWQDQWQELPGVYPIRCVRGAAPVEQTADLVYDFGSIKRETATTFSTEIPKDLRDWYVKIELYDKNDDEATPKRHWYGVIPKSTILRKGGVLGVDTGRQTFQAVGLEHLLDRQFVADAHALQNNTVVKIEHVPTFNVKYKKGLKVKGNRSADFGPDGVVLFDNSADAKVWSNSQICEYLLEYFKPKGSIKWEFTGQLDALEAIEEVYRSPANDPRSLWEWFKILIDRRRGVSFYLEPSTDELTIEIHVFTLTNTPISIGGRTIPSNDRQQSFTMPSTFPDWHLVEPIEFTKTTANVFDWIEVRGERILGCTTVAWEDQRLDIGSTEEERQEYIDAEEEERTQDRFDGTFNRFILHDNWTYAVNTLLGDNASDSLLLKCDDDGNVTTGAGTSSAWYDATLLERSLPFKKNVDYTQNPPELLYDEKDRPEFQPIMVFVKLPEDVDGAGTYRLVDRMGDTDTQLPNCSVRALDTRAGFEIGCSPRHLFAIPDWPTDAEGAFTDVEQPPRLDYTEMGATIAFRINRRLKVRRQITSTVPHETERTLVIMCPGAEYWYATRGTVVDVGGGNLKRLHPNNRVLRDDGDVVRGVAAFAEAWYAKERQTVRIAIKQLDNWAELGVLLTTIGGQYQEEANTVISSVETDFQTKVIEYRSGWGDFDLVGAMLDQQKGLGSKRANEFEYFGDA